jgi:hypothetical protein
MPDPERKRQPALFEAFGFSVEANACDALSLHPQDSAGELAATTLPPTSRQHPERQDLGLVQTGPHSISIVSQRMAKRPANWVRKMNALHAALSPMLAAREALLLPGPSPFGLWSPDELMPACFRSGLRLDLHFAREQDFGRLHAAVRMALPLLPALSAATPIRDGRSTGFHSARLRACLDLYDLHPARIGGFIPEPVFDAHDYDREVLGPILQAIATSRGAEATDAQALNLRAATAQFDSGILSIHAIDAQENPAADMAVLEFTIALLRALVAGRWSSNYLQRAWNSEDLMSVMLGTIRDGSKAVIGNRDFLFMLGILKQEQATAAEVLKHLFVELYSDLSENARAHLAVIIEHGCLASRIMAKAGKRATPEKLRTALAQLAACRTAGAFI